MGLCGAHANMPEGSTELGCRKGWLWGPRVRREQCSSDASGSPGGASAGAGRAHGCKHAWAKAAPAARGGQIPRDGAAAQRLKALPLHPRRSPRQAPCACAREQACWPWRAASPTTGGPCQLRFVLARSLLLGRPAARALSFGATLRRSLGAGAAAAAAPRTQSAARPASPPWPPGRRAWRCATAAQGAPAERAPARDALCQARAAEARASAGRAV